MCEAGIYQEWERCMTKTVCGRWFYPFGGRAWDWGGVAAAVIARAYHPSLSDLSTCTARYPNFGMRTPHDGRPAFNNSQL